MREARAGRGSDVTVKLNRTGFDRARALVDKGRLVADERNAWTEHQPSAQDENDFIRRHGIDEYGLWHLGIDDDARQGTKLHYKFPYGDFKNVHRCNVLAAESRAGQYKYHDIEDAAARIHSMIDALAHHK
jgi:hypothetical protein